VLAQNLLPRLAAVFGAIDAALAIRPEGVAQHRGKRDVRVRRMDNQCANLSVLLPNLFPALAAVSGLVDSVTGLDIVTNVGFARAHVDDVWIRWSNRQRADGGNRLVVEHGLPVVAAVSRLPDSTCRGGRV